MPANQKPKGVGAQRRSLERKVKPQFGRDCTDRKHKPSTVCPIVGIGGSADNLRKSAQSVDNTFAQSAVEIYL